MLGCAALLLSARAAQPETLPYRETLLELCDALLSTQITAATSPDYGALVCPSTNPQEHPLHSRAGEAVYPFAIAFRETRDPKYRDAALALAHWMIGRQQATGGWGEDWPKYDGWTGTTSDQLISLAAAYPIFAPRMTAAQRAEWERSMRAAADFIVRTFPAGNVNYQPTGAVSLWLAADVLPSPSSSWRAKADALMQITLHSINADGLLTGEGNGVDGGYNLAQSIGYIALYGRLAGSETIRHTAAEMLRAHSAFLYPNGTVDNSWGTRSFKWTYESGTKTAPGVPFSFALLADLDGRFAGAAAACFAYLTQHTMHDGFVQYGPHAARHASTREPCLYSTFARAQSLALALAYGAAPAADAGRTPFLAGQASGYRFYPTLNVAVVRTPAMMATLSAYGAISRYGRGLVARGGSLTNLWIDGFGDDGFAQTSSVTRYRREEAAHMPIESDLRTLTPRLEGQCDGRAVSNLFEADGTMAVSPEPEGTAVTVTGRLRAADGWAAPGGYRITHRFSPQSLVKEYAITGADGLALQVVEPLVKQPGMTLKRISDTRVEIRFANGQAWLLEFAGTQSLRIGEDAEKYWCPFPGVECVPITADVPVRAGSATVHVTLARAPRARSARVALAAVR